MPFKTFRKVKFEEDAYLFQNRTTCAVLVQRTTRVGKTRNWRAGLRVRDARIGQIEKYTAIATFNENGRYPGRPTGNHAAIYLSHDSNGITVIDQWEGKPTPSKRKISFKGKSAGDPSNNGDFFYVIETDYTILQAAFRRQGAELI
jgi:hypothetical protein